MKARKLKTAHHPRHTAARAAPTLGSTDLAKESLSCLAVPSAGLLLLGVAAVIALTTFELFAPRTTSTA